MTTTDAVSDTAEKRAPIWQRHRRLSIAAVVLVIALITVLTDLPTSTSRASDISAERSVMSEVNSDLGPCAYGIHQALGIWALASTHRLSAADRAPTPGLLSDDQSACSLTNQSTYDLASNIQTPTTDALRAVEDVQTLMNDPGSAAARRDLKAAETLLARDRATAVAAEDAADRDLDTHLAPVDLPAQPSSGS
jgi:hypothetical protein